MAQSVGSQRIKLKFLFQKDNNEIKLVRFSAVDSGEWRFIDTEFQALDHHEALCAKTPVRTALEVIERQRTVTIYLTEEEAAPYLEGHFEEGSVSED